MPFYLASALGRNHPPSPSAGEVKLVQERLIPNGLNLTPFLGENESFLETIFESNNQSMIVACMTRVYNGWTMEVIAKPVAASTWGFMIPQLKEVLKTLPEAKADKIHINYR